MPPHSLPSPRWPNPEILSGQTAQNLDTIPAKVLKNRRKRVRRRLRAKDSYGGGGGGEDKEIERETELLSDPDPATELSPPIAGIHNPIKRPKKGGRFSCMPGGGFANEHSNSSFLPDQQQHTRGGRDFHGCRSRAEGTLYENDSFPQRVSDIGRDSTSTVVAGEELTCADGVIDTALAASQLSLVSNSCNRIWEELCTAMRLRDSIADQARNEIEASLTRLRSQEEAMARERTQLDELRRELESMRGDITKSHTVACEEANKVKMEKEALYVVSTDLSVQLAELKSLKHKLEDDWAKIAIHINRSTLKKEECELVENGHASKSIDKEKLIKMKAEFLQQKSAADNLEWIVSERLATSSLSASSNASSKFYKRSWLGQPEFQREPSPIVEVGKVNEREEELWVASSSASMIDYAVSVVMRAQRNSGNIDSSVVPVTDHGTLKRGEAQYSPASIFDSALTDESQTADRGDPGRIKARDYMLGCNSYVCKEGYVDMLDEMSLSQRLEMMRKGSLVQGFEVKDEDIEDGDSSLVFTNTRSTKGGGLYTTVVSWKENSGRRRRPVKSTSEKQTKKYKIPINVALQEDAPGLYEKLNDKRLLDDSEVYGDFAEEFCSEPEFQLENFKDLEEVMGKLWSTPTGLFKLPAVNREHLGNSKTSYCISCLASLIEQTRSMKQRGWIVEWGWCRELRSFIFIFEKHNRIVLERPEYGYATYFFELLENVPSKWQVARLIRVMSIANTSRTALIENRPLEVYEHLTVDEAKILEDYGWTPNTGLGSLLNFCDRVIHDIKDEDSRYWKHKIGRCLMDGYDHGRISKGIPPKLAGLLKLPNDEVNRCIVNTVLNPTPLQCKVKIEPQ